MADNIIRIEHLPNGEPHVSTLAGRAVEPVVGQQLGQPWAVTPDDLQREIEAGQPFAERADLLGRRAQRNNNTSRVNSFELREHTFGGKPGVLPFGHREDNRRPVGRCGRDVFAEPVERCNPFLDVLHH
jgi:hypothetical protein